MRPISNSRGAGLMILILVVATLVGSVVISTSMYFARLQLQVSQQRDRAYAIQVLQEFAVYAQKANDNYVTNGNSCPGGYTTWPTGSVFCWHGTLAPSTEVCVKDPRNASLICMDTGASAKASVATLELRRTIKPWDRLLETARYVFQDRAEIWDIAMKDLNRWTSNLAFATPTGMESHIPDITGPPTNDITNATCNGVVTSDFCKVCASNVSCVELRFCLDSSCTNSAPFARYFRQRIGIMAR